MTSSELRLDDRVRPVRYDTSLHVDPAKETFEGQVRIQVEVGAPTNEIRLHARGLTLQSAELATLECETFDADEPSETVLLVFPEAVDAGKHTLTIQYTGRVRSDMAGLYLSKDGDEACLATQCEATDARSILPCWDEPAFKAQFAWQITAPDENVVFANGPLIETKDNGDGTKSWVFDATPKMSSYLCAFAVGRFGSTTAVEARGKPLRVHALAGKENYGEHGRDLAAELLVWYEDYFDQPYPFSHYDQIAVPSFSFGAMENPGLVVFRASLLLLNPKTASWSDTKSVDLVVAHEFAHMWFGNLVTMAWWDDLWLNEAFAEWIAHKAIDELRPDHHVWQQFQDRASGAMATDALTSTHAIYHPVKSPAEAAEMFDSITYGKGSATMRMLENYLGEQTFRAGLRTYMAAFHHDNAHGQDLWKHLSDASGQNVGAIMDSWIRQAGHPAVTVAIEETAQRSLLHVTQARAQAHPDAPASDALWHVPLVIRYQDDEGTKTHRHLLTKKEETIGLEVNGLLHWLHPNADDAGVYRSALTDELAERSLSNYLHLSPTERKGLLRDAWSKVRVGGPLAPFLKLVETAVALDDHYAVVGQVVGMLRGLETRLETQKDANALAAFRGWVATRYISLHEDLAETEAGADPETMQLRAAVFRATAGIGRHAACLRDVQRIADNEREHPQDIDATIAGAAVAIAAAHGDATHYERHLQTYIDRKKAAKSPQEVERYLYTLGAPRDPALIKRTLGIMADGTVPPQAVGPLLRMLLSEPHSGDQAWDYVTTHWDQVRKQLGNAWTAIIVEASGEGPLDKADTMIAFYDEHLGDAAPQAYLRAKERLSERAALKTRIDDQLVTWANGLSASMRVPDAATGAN